jgi:chemotaxis protein CheY-P-specific phosphatase CheC
MNETISIDKSAHDVLVRVLEEWAMMMTDTLGSTDGQFDEDAPFYSAVLQFVGESKQGRCELLCQKAFLNALGFSLLDPEDADDETMQLDALGEMGNVICGNFVTEAFGSEEVYHLTIPVCRAVDIAALQRVLASSHAVCLADEAAVVLSVEVLSK